MALVCGAVWGIVTRFVPLNLNLLLAPGAGYVIGEVVGLSVNRKRGRGLATIAGSAVAVSYFITFLFPDGFTSGLFNIIYHLVALALGIFVAVTRLR